MLLDILEKILTLDSIRHRQETFIQTFLAMAGDTEVVEKLKKGYKAIGRTYKNHIDGFNLLPYLTGEVTESPRNFYFYFSDDGDMLGMRFDNWKLVFMEQRCKGTLQIWAEPFIPFVFQKFSTSKPIHTNSGISLRILTMTG
jgi:hypothetical protein